MFCTVTVFLARISFLLTILLLISTGPAAAQAPAWAWGLQSTNPTPTDGSGATANTIAADATGRAFVAGTYGNPGTSRPFATRRFGSAGTVGPGRSGFVAQATANGQWAWVVDVVPVVRPGSSFIEASVMGMAVTAAGDVYITGTVSGAGLQVGTMTQPLVGATIALFVAKLTNGGVCQWIEFVNASFFALSMAADPSTGGVVVAGMVFPRATFGAITLTIPINAGNAGIFVARLNAAGQWQSAVLAAGRGYVEKPCKVAVGSAGQVSISGRLSGGEYTFGATTIVPPPNPSTAVFVAQLSPSNQWDWAVVGSGRARGEILRAAYTPAGKLWVSGWGTTGTVVGPLTLTAAPSVAFSNYVGFVGQLSATGQWGTVRELPCLGNGWTGLGSLVADSSGNAVVQGTLIGYTGSVQTTLGSLTLVLPTSGELHFLASLTEAGTWRHLTSFPTLSLSWDWNDADITLAGNNNLYFASGLVGSATFGSSTLNGSSNGNLAGNVQGDVLLAKLSNATALPARAAAPTASLVLFPSPAHHTATLRLPAPATAETTFALLDALGRTARTVAVPASASEARLDLQGLPAGLYLVRGGGMSARLVIE